MLTKFPSLFAGHVNMVRLYRPNIRFMNQALGYDMRLYFADDVRETTGSLPFSAAGVVYYYNKINELCRTYGLHFSTCYTGNDPMGERMEEPYQHAVLSHHATRNQHPSSVGAGDRLWTQNH
jgi:hypothetical protein